MERKTKRRKNLFIVFCSRCGALSAEMWIFLRRAKGLLAQMQKVGVVMDQKDDRGKIATILGMRKEWEEFWRGCRTRNYIHRHHSHGHNLLFCYSAKYLLSFIFLLFCSV